jgi:hypothetical protein
VEIGVPVAAERVETLLSWTGLMLACSFVVMVTIGI